MALCKFFAQGNCRNGNNCRFEHPSGGNNRGNQGGNNRNNQDSNRYGALGGGGGGGRSQNALEKYHISLETLQNDLTADAPQWILSAYAPGRDAPQQLFGGSQREQSFEEMRIHYLQRKAEGNEAQAHAEAEQLYIEAKKQMVNAVQNARDAAHFILDGENQHPNRHDICQQGTGGYPFGKFALGSQPAGQATTAASGSFGAPASNPFGNAPPTGGSAFGQPSALGQQPSGFGTPAFGQPSQPSGSAFGQTQQPASAFGQQPTQSPGQTPFGQPVQPTANPFGQPTFGQPSQPNTGGSAFGQPSQLGNQPSAFGQPTNPTPAQAAPTPNAFGQPSQPGNAFGQPSQPANAAPAFGQPSQPGPSGSAFGQPSQLGAGSAFGQPSQPRNSGSAFGQPSQLGQNPNPFGTDSNTSNASPFANAGPATNAPANPFASTTNAPNAFQSPPATGSAFGQPSQPGNRPNPFGTSSEPPSSGQSNPFASKADGPSGFEAFATSKQPEANGTFGRPSESANPFGAPSGNSFGQPATNAPSALPAANGPAGGPPPGNGNHPPLESYSSKGMDGRLTMFKGKAVRYKDDKPGVSQFDGTWHRIWFPNGAPPPNRDATFPAEKYDDTAKQQWSSFAETGKFVNGLMPELPPPRECIKWTF